MQVCGYKDGHTVAVIPPSDHTEYPTYEWVSSNAMEL